VTKSHLSRIENGQAEPTFPRMFALSQVYGLPISMLAERFESDLRLEMRPADIDGRADDDVYEEAEKLRANGRYEEALLWYEVLIYRETAGGIHPVELSLRRVTCLVQLKRFTVAREEAELVLGQTTLSDLQRAQTMFLLALCCYRTNRLSIAKLILEPTGKLIRQLESSETLKAQFDQLVGALASHEKDYPTAAAAFLRARETLTQIGEMFEACRARINYANQLIEIGKPREARRQLGISLDDASRLHYDRLKAFALTTLGRLSFIESDYKTAESYCLMSNSVARAHEFHPLIFSNCFYLWKIATIHGDSTAIKTHERTLRTYVGRMERSMPEAIEFQKHLAGGDA